MGYANLIKDTFYMEVCDIQKKALGVLTDNTPHSAYNISTEEQENDCTQISFSISGNSPKLKYLINENFICMDDEYYQIQTPTMNHDDNTVYEVKCEHEAGSLKTKMCGKFEIPAMTVKELVNEVLKNTQVNLKNSFVFGETDIGNDVKRHLYSDEESVFSNLIQIAENFDARVVFKTVNGVITINYYKEGFDNGRFIERTRDSKSISLTYDTTDMVTRLEYFGGTDKLTGNEVTMMSANPTGKTYVEDYSYYTNQGYDLNLVKSLHCCVKELRLRNTDLLTPKQVYDMALQELKVLSKPKLNATVNLVDIQMIKTYKLKPMRIGEIVTIYDKVINLELKATIVSISKNSENPLDISIGISNVVELSSAFKDLVNSGNVIDKITDSNDKVNGNWIQDGTIHTAHIKELHADKIIAGTITADKIHAHTITANEIKAGSITATEIKAGSITAGSGIIADGAIGTAQISNLDANVINAGTIDTSKVRVSSANSEIEIRGNQIMVNDTTNALDKKNRVILGEYKVNEITKYGLLVRGKDGTTTLIDENGVHKGGITDGAVTNNTIADNSITGNKVDINSIIRTINENGTEVISGTKVQIGNNTLEVVIGQHTNTLTEYGKRLESQQAEIKANKDSISLKVDNQTYAEDKQNINSTIVGINNKIDNLGIGSSNLLMGTEFEDESKFTLSKGSGANATLVINKNEGLTVNYVSGAYEVYQNIKKGNIIFENGKPYTLSFECKSNIDADIKIRISDNDNSSLTEGIIPLKVSSGVVSKYNVTLNVNTDVVKLENKFSITSNTPNHIFTIKPKSMILSQSSNPAPWSPNIEDVNENITRLEGKLAEITSDNVLTPNEKYDVKREMERITIEAIQLNLQADIYPEIVNEKSIYNTNLSNLQSYINPLLAQMNDNSSIEPVIFNKKFNDYYDSKEKLVTKITKIAKSKTDKAEEEALNAKNNANSALQEANKSKEELKDMANVNKVTPSEKVSLKKEVEEIKLEYIENIKLADIYLIISEKNIYVEKYNSLISYTNVILQNMGITSDIVGSEFEGKFNDYYISRQKLLNKVNSLAKELSVNAQNTANKAEQDAKESNDKIISMSSDNTLTAIEKKTVNKEFIEISQEKVSILKQATYFNVDTSLYIASYNDLDNYLNNSVNGILADLTSDTVIDRTTFNSKFDGYYSKRQEVLNKIAETSELLSSNAQNTANKAEQDAKDAQRELSDIASNNKITPVEKVQLDLKANEIIKEKTGIVSEATRYNVDSRYYVEKYNILYEYLYGQRIMKMIKAGTNMLVARNVYVGTEVELGGILNDLTITSNIDSSVFHSKFENYYHERQRILDIISLKAKEYSDKMYEDSKKYADGQIEIVNKNLSKHTAEIEVLKDSITSKIWQTDIDQTIANVEFGGTNLISYTDLDRNISEHYKKITNNTIIEYANNLTHNNKKLDNQLLIKSSNNSSEYGFKIDLCEDIEINKEYTLSFKGMSRNNNDYIENIEIEDVDGRNRIRIVNSTNKMYFNNYGDTWRVSKVTFTSNVKLTQPKLIFKKIANASLSYNYYGLWNLQLEKGENVSSWRPSNLEVKKSNVDYTNTTINEYKNEISQTLNGINLAVSKNTQNITSVTTDFNNMELGGVQLLPNTDFKENSILEKWKIYNNGSNAKMEWTSQYSGSVRVFTSTVQNGVPVAFYTDSSIKIQSGQDYTLSFKCKPSDSVSVLNYCQLLDENNNIIEKIGDIALNSTSSTDLDLARVSLTFKPKNNISKGKVLIGCLKDGTYGFLIKEIKLEKGNKRTGWSSSEKDLDNKLDNIETNPINLIPSSDFEEFVNKSVEPNTVNVTEWICSSGAAFDVKKYSNANETKLFLIGTYPLTLRANGSSGNIYCSTKAKINVQVGETYTLSAYVMKKEGSEFTYASVYSYDDNGSSGQKLVGETNKITQHKGLFERISFTFKAERQVYEIRFNSKPFSSSQVNEIHILQPMLSKGDRIIDWIPSSADISRRVTTNNNKSAGIEIKLDSVSTKVQQVDSKTVEINGKVTKHEERITTAEEKIQPDRIIQTVTSSKTYTDDITNRPTKTEMNSAIDQKVSSISLKVSKLEETSNIHATELGQVDGKIDNAKDEAVNSSNNHTNSQIGVVNQKITENISEINILKNKISLKVEQTDIDKTVNNIQIGGRNLLPKTSKDYMSATMNEWNSLFYQHNLTELDLTVGDTITFRIYTKLGNVACGGSARISFYDINNNNIQSNASHEYIKPNSEGYTEVTSKIPSNTVKVLCGLQREDAGNGKPTFTFDYKRAKLEKGNKATDWSSSEKDLEEFTTSKITEAKSEIKLTTDNISLEVSKKVNGNQIISSINQSAEAVKIQASKIHLDGATTIGDDQRHHILIDKANYSIYDGSKRVGYLGFQNDEKGGHPKLVLGWNGIDLTKNDYFTLHAYPTATNPENHPRSYVDMAFHCINFNDWSNIKMYGDGKIVIAPLTSLEIKTNSVDGSYAGGEERRLCLFDTSTSTYFNSNLQIPCVRNMTSGYGLILADDSVGNVQCRVRVQVDGSNNKFFRPLTTSGDIELGSGGYKWKKIFAVNGVAYSVNEKPIVSRSSNLSSNSNLSDVIDKLDFEIPAQAYVKSKENSQLGLNIARLKEHPLSNLFIHKSVETEADGSVIEDTSVDMTSLLHLALLEIQNLKQEVENLKASIV